jgi:hypothetical protein
MKNQNINKNNNFFPKLVKFLKIIINPIKYLKEKKKKSENDIYPLW